MMIRHGVATTSTNITNVNAVRKPSFDWAHVLVYKQTAIYARRNGSIEIQQIVHRELPPIFRHHQFDAPLVHIASNSCDESGHVIFLLENGAVWVWGANVDGQLGMGRFFVEDILRPVPIVVPTKNGKGIVNASCGHFHTVLVASNEIAGTMNLTSRTTLFASGSNKKSNLGVSKDICRHASASFIKVPIAGLYSEEYIQDLSCGSYHTVVYTSMGRAFAFGDNSVFQCGIDKGSLEISEPTLIDSIDYTLFPIVQVSCALALTVFLSKCGRVLCCGAQNSTVFRIPALIDTSTFSPDCKVTQVAAKYNDLLFVTENPSSLFISRPMDGRASLCDAVPVTYHGWESREAKPWLNEHGRWSICAEFNSFWFRWQRTILDSNIHCILLQSQQANAFHDVQITCWMDPV